MSLRLYNTLTRRTEEFRPLEPGRVRMYSCGPTVYRYAHIGNLRTYLMADWLRRVLEALGYEVVHVKNITDVGHMRQEQLERGEDKVIAAALAEGKTPQQIAQFYTEAFLRDEALLNILPAHHLPRASEHVSDMVSLVQRLLEKGHAYERQGNVYFDVSTFPAYGRLSGQTGAGLVEGVRVEPDPLKRDQRDFTLWKAAEPGRMLKWPSPWGEGFPGWHIECSAMAIRYLGPRLDIHTGGVDNIFPHHEDELAQSEAAYGGPFVRYWVHGQHLLVDGLKMAKSTGNVYTLDDLTRRGFEPLAFRYLCATVHYRTRMNFTWDSLRAAQRGLLRLRLHAQQADEADVNLPEEALQWRRRFWEALCEDLSLPRALAVAWCVARSRLSAPVKRRLLLEFDRVLGLDLDRRAEVAPLPGEVVRLARQRESLRAQGRWAEADRIRERLAEMGYEVRDGRGGSSVLLRPRWLAQPGTISRSSDVPSLLREAPTLEFSVSLLARDELPALQRCLRALLRWLPPEAEVLVVDNGSSDDTGLWLDGLAAEEGRLRVFHADHFLGAAAARNVTVRQARGRIFLWMDVSVELTGDVFSPIARVLSRPEVGMVGRWGLRSSDLRSFDEVQEGGEVDALEGYLMALRRDVLVRVAPLDEKFRFYRHLDLDVSLAVRSLGYVLVCDPGLPAVRHAHGEWERTPPEERERLSKRNFYRFLRRWGGRQDLLVGSH
ncbi:MAG TPA: cysteine--tRNA ligase [Dehalococcoidia bacterium]|nr:cysteine--tRNA ligase [Dehalococcoidia bacterium]